MHRHFQSTLILMNIETANCANTLENTLPYDIRIRNVPSESISPHWIVLADCLTTGVNDIWIILSQVWLLSNRKVLLHIQSDDFRKIISKSYNFIKNICVLHTTIFLHTSIQTYKNKDNLGKFNIFYIKNNQTKGGKYAHCAQKDRKVFKINQTKIWKIDHCALKKTRRYSVGRKQQWRNLKRTALLIIVKNSHFDLWSFSNSPCIYHPSLQQWSQWSKNENIIWKVVIFIKIKGVSVQLFKSSTLLFYALKFCSF